MRTLCAVAAVAVAAVGGSTGCSSAAAADLVVGDCVKMGGTPERPEATKAVCGSPESNFRVVEVISGPDDGTEQCPVDVDSYYSMISTFSDTKTTVCLDVDWVVGGCMSIDPDNGRDPLRVDCADAAAPGRQRATEILQDVANVDQCASGVGYAYDERNFTVCVEDVT
ncbi:LppU family putative lipoprotein [Mycolicibacterium sp.]|uniref:LppU family putative lipoprotein n=1 Tax=Mycolicibacterium sp. TaxID=2320850 RepID=UPI003D12DC25